MQQMVDSIMKWYKENKRELPFRNNPSLYQIYISEIMLQQTRAQAVIPYYERFIKEVPSFYELSIIDDEKLNKLWEGLGYYSRARNLKKCAIEITNIYSGIFPKEYDKALALPGIGAYTAGAILSRGYNLPYAAVDGNVLRVFTRVYMDSDDILKEQTKLKYKKKIEAFIPEKSGDFNQALMDLGSMICTPKVANCTLCPLSVFCKAHKKGQELEYPKKKEKSPKKEFNYSLLFVTDGIKYILTKKEDGLLSGLMAPILIEGQKKEVELFSTLKDIYRIEANSIHLIGHDKHVFTHQIWHMDCYKVYTDSLKGYSSFTKEEILHEIGLPTCYRKFLDFLFKSTV